MTPLWDCENETQYSSIFTIKPGYVGLLIASGFEKYRYRASAEEAQALQGACVYKYMAFDSCHLDKAIVPVSICDYVYDYSMVHTTFDEAWAPVNRCGKSWFISACDNIKIIGIPGTYQLYLNDSTAIGQAQVWLDTLPFDKIPVQVSDYFF